MRDVRHVVASSTGRRVLYGAVEHDVVVCDLVEKTKSPVFTTTWDGGPGLALSERIGGVVAAAWYVHGVALYDASTGAERWRRKDLKKVQSVTLSRDGAYAHCGRHAATLVTLDVATGETTSLLRGAKALHESPWGPHALVDGKRPHVRDGTGRRAFDVVRTTFAILAVVFTPNLLVISFAGGPVRIISLESGRELWRYVPPAGSHVLHLGYHSDAGELLLVQWDYEKGGPKTVLRWTIAGTLAGHYEIGGVTDCAFALGGSVLVLSDGRVLDALSGLAVSSSPDRP